MQRPCAVFVIVHHRYGAHDWQQVVLMTFMTAANQVWLCSALKLTHSARLTLDAGLSVLNEKAARHAARAGRTGG